MQYKLFISQVYMQYKLCTYLQYDAMKISYIQKDIQMIDNTYTMIIVISVGSFINCNIKIYAINTRLLILHLIYTSAKSHASESHHQIS